MSGASTLVILAAGRRTGGYYPSAAAPSGWQKWDVEIILSILAILAGVVFAAALYTLGGG